MDLRLFVSLSYICTLGIYIFMTAIEFKAKIAGGCLSLVGHLTLRVLYGIGDFAAWFMRRVLHYRENVVLTNISRAFPKMWYDDVRRLADAYYSRIGELFAETIWFGGCNGNGAKLRKQKIYEYTNPELLLKYHAERGIMSMKSHCGNWELFGGIYDYCESFRGTLDMDDVYVAYRAMHSPVSDKVFYENRRAPLPGFKGLVEDTKLMRHAVARKDARPIYILNADQFPYKACHPVGIFLNQETQGMLGGFSLASKLGFAVLYMREERVSRGHYKLTFEVISETALGQDPEKLMRQYYDLLEADIVKDPVNWLWSHKRWH